MQRDAVQHWKRLLLQDGTEWLQGSGGGGGRVGGGGGAGNGMTSAKQSRFGRDGYRSLEASKRGRPPLPTGTAGAGGEKHSGPAPVRTAVAQASVGLGPCTPPAL